MLTPDGTQPSSSSGLSQKWGVPLIAWNKGGMKIQTRLTQSSSHSSHLISPLKSLSKSSQSWRKFYSCQKSCLEMKSQLCIRSSLWSSTWTPSCFPRWGLQAKNHSRRIIAQQCQRSWTGGTQRMEPKWRLTAFPICFILFSEVLSWTTLKVLGLVLERPSWNKMR